MVPETDMNFMKYREIQGGKRAMCGLQLKDRKRSKNLMLSLNETVDRMAMASSDC